MIFYRPWIKILREIILHWKNDLLLGNQKIVGMFQKEQPSLNDSGKFD